VGVYQAMEVPKRIVATQPNSWPASTTVPLDLSQPEPQPPADLVRWRAPPDVRP
jgi:hypothetical protein